MSLFYSKLSAKHNPLAELPQCWSEKRYFARKIQTNHARGSLRFITAVTFHTSETYSLAFFIQT